MDGACAFLILPAADTECFQIFLDTMGKRFSRQHILLILDGAPNHTTDDLLIPANRHARILAAVFTKIFKNYALKSMDKVCDKLEEAALYIERNPKMVKSITSFPYIVRSM